MSKQLIVHQKYDLNMFRAEDVRGVHKNVQKALPKDVIVITTPTDIAKINGDDILIQINSEDYSLDKLLDMIDKAMKYEDLCD